MALKSALCAIIACLVTSAIEMAFYAPIVPSGEAFFGFVPSTSLAVATIALPSRFALPLLKPREARRISRTCGRRPIPSPCPEAAVPAGHEMANRHRKAGLVRRWLGAEICGSS